MNVRRALSGIATGALLVGLTACGGGGDQAAQASSDAAAPAADAAAPAADAAAPAADAAADPNNGAPGTGKDAYKADDPFVAGNTKVADVPMTIAAAGFLFTKTKFVAHPGEMWTFNNADIATHNVETIGKNPATFKSPDAMAGQKVKFKIPAKKGTYHVVCKYHQAMLATITVK